jgi:hypothetical protein
MYGSGSRLYLDILLPLKLEQLVGKLRSVYDVTVLLLCQLKIKIFKYGTFFSEIPLVKSPIVDKHPNPEQCRKGMHNYALR